MRPRKRIAMICADEHRAGILALVLTSKLPCSILFCAAAEEAASVDCWAILYVVTPGFLDLNEDSLNGADTPVVIYDPAGIMLRPAINRSRYLGKSTDTAGLLEALSNAMVRKSGPRPLTSTLKEECVDG